jgi:hypothetical protein
MDDQTSPLAPSDLATTTSASEVVNSPKKRNRGLIAIACFMLVVLIAGIAVVLGVLDRRNPYATLVLSTGKELSLGQSVDSVKKSLGHDLVENPANPGIYRFPFLGTDGRQKEEVFIFTVSDKVVAMRVLRNEAHKQKNTGIGIGTKIVDVQQRFGDTATPFKEQKPLKMSGYSYVSGNTKSFYFTNQCSTNDKIISIGIAYIENEALVTKGGSGCNVYSE